MKWLIGLFFAFIGWLIAPSGLQAADNLMLRDNLQRAEPGDYVVFSSGKIQTLMHVYDKKDQTLTIEEITLPDSKYHLSPNWKHWVNQNAPGHTSWTMYDIDLSTGQMTRYYSFTRRNWFKVSDADNFLSKLLNLKLNKIPDGARKRIGPKPISGPEWRSLWQPRMIVEGRQVNGVEFDAWQTKWPRDGSDLSGRTIDIYLPKDNQRYSSYFPHWLQIHGIAKTKIRIVDSGKQLRSPKPNLSTFSNKAPQSGTKSENSARERTLPKSGINNH